MTPKLYWVEGPWAGRLAIAARPRGGDWLEDEIRGWRQAGIDVAASLLTAEESDVLGVSDEAAVAKAAGVAVLSFPIADRSVPGAQTGISDFIRVLHKHLAAGEGVAVHCRQGLGRSALVAASLLVLAGIDPEDAIGRVQAARGCQVPETPEQRDWVFNFANDVASVPLTG